MTIDELERLAHIASSEEGWTWNEDGALETTDTAQIVLFASCPHDEDSVIMCSVSDRAHIAANSPPVTLALIERIRVLEVAVLSGAQHLRFASGELHNLDSIRCAAAADNAEALVLRGTVLP
jgi:hypothetical protein